jgi:hypothetical protein
MDGLLPADIAAMAAGGAAGIFAARAGAAARALLFALAALLSAFGAALGFGDRRLDLPKLALEDLNLPLQHLDLLRGSRPDNGCSCEQPTMTLQHCRRLP